MSQPSFYQEDLAHVHDQSYSELSVEAANTLIQALRESNIYEGKVIDLGCGSGQFVQQMAKTGFDTIGIDISAPLLQLAQQKAPQSQFIHQSIWDYSFPSCVAVSAISEILNYRIDDRNQEARIVQLFQQIYDALIPGGVWLFDILEKDVIKDGDYDCKLIEHDHWTMAVEYKEDKEHAFFTRTITLFRKLDNELYRKSKEVHEVRLFDKAFMLNVLMDIGFSVTTFKQYGPISLRDNHIAILATKPK